MDYSFYSKNPNYFGLVMDFEEIAKVLKKEFLEFEMEGHEPENSFFFGFSFGGQLTLEVGRHISKLHSGNNLISRMDRKCNECAFYVIK